MLNIGSKAPDFNLPDQNSQEHRLADYLGQWVLLYFYPKDDTSGCTMEACSVRDHLPDFEKLTATVLGVSVDSVSSHQKFAEKYQLPFTLLADENKEAVQLYGVWDNGIKRTSFLINPLGNIAKIYEQVKPETHIAEVLEDLKSLTS